MASAGLPERLRAKVLEYARIRIESLCDSWSLGPKVEDEFVSTEEGVPGAINAAFDEVLAELSAQQPEPPAAGELPAEIHRRALDLLEPMYQEFAKDDSSVGPDDVVHCLRPLLASAPEDAESLRAALRRFAPCRASNPEDCSACHPDDSGSCPLELLASAPAEVARWAEVVSAVSRVLGEPTGNGIWADLVLDAIRPLWPPARLEAVRELADKFGKWAGDAREAAGRSVDDAGVEELAAEAHAFAIAASELRTTLGLPSKEKDHA